MVAMLYNQYLQNDNREEDDMPANVKKYRYIFIKNCWINVLSINCIHYPEKNGNYLQK